MWQRISIFFFVLCLQSASAQKSWTSFIPAGYDTLFSGAVTGDLNRDGVEDMALALYPRWEKDSNWMAHDADSMPRLLVVLFGKGKGYELSIRSAHVIECKGCGGVMGDPFVGLAISKGVLLLYHFSGSSWKSSTTHKFRFQNGEWYLIGQTVASWFVQPCEKLGEFAGLDLEDVNFVTGQFRTKKISEDCRLLENKRGKRKVEPLVLLKNFSTN